MLVRSSAPLTSCFLQSDESDMNEEMRNLDSGIRTLDTQIAAEELKSQEHTQAKRDECNRKLCEAEEQVRAMPQQFEDGKAGLRNLEDQQNRSQGELAQMSGKHADADRAKKDCGIAIENCRRQQTDKMAAFVSDARTVFHRIEQRRWHGQKPIGPLGQFVTLTDPTWANLMRSQLGSQMQAFAITDPKDRAPLKEILNSTHKSVFAIGCQVS